jgi:transcriptional regulator with XRE-family HTH domain
VAGLTGITADYLYQIERGMKLPTVTVPAKLAEVLGVSVAELLGQEAATSTRPSNTAAGAAIYCALVNPPISVTFELPAVTELHERIARAWRTWQTSPQRYSQLAGRLPQLIVDTESAVWTVPEQLSTRSGTVHRQCLTVIDELRWSEHGHRIHADDRAIGAG